MIGRIVREVLLLCALAAAPAAITGYRELKLRPQTPLASGEVMLGDAQAWGDKAIWVDARPAPKFERKHIPGALSLNAETWDAQVARFLDAWDPEMRVIVYGERGDDAAPTVALRLREELKIPEVWVLHDGLDAWEGR
ncbi:MAG: rhodanese-like domain-containing protein [Chthoniobacteraceae bacterium]